MAKMGLMPPMMYDHKVHQIVEALKESFNHMRDTDEIYGYDIGIRYTTDGITIIDLTVRPIDEPIVLDMHVFIR